MSEVEKELRAGDEALWANDLGSALRHYERARAADPTDETAMVALANLLRYTGRSQEALSTAQSCLRVHEGSTRALVVAAAACMDLRKFGESLAYLDQAGNVAPDDPAVWALRVRVLLALGRLSEAGRAVGTLERVDPVGVELRLLRVDMARAARRHRDALEYAISAVSSYPACERCALCVGQVLLDLRRASEALEWFEYALQLSPGWWEALLYCGIARGRTGDVAGAAECLERAIRANPRRPEAYAELMRLYARKLMFRRLLEAMRRCTDREPS